MHADQKLMTLIEASEWLAERGVKKSPWSLWYVIYYRKGELEFKCIGNRYYTSIAALRAWASNCTRKAGKGKLEVKELPL